MKYVNGSFSALFTGDIDFLTEEDLVNSGKDLSADVLKVAHHGGNTSTSELFLKKVNPSWAVISVGKDNPHGHPHSETLNNLARHNVTVYRTDLFGTIIATNDGSAWSFEVKKAR